MPTRVNLNPGYGSPTSIAIGAIAAFGALVALIIMAIVILYRKREVFKAARYVHTMGIDNEMSDADFIL